MATMAEDHKRDYEAKGRFDDAIRALDALVEPEPLRRLSDAELQKLIDARDLLQKRSAHIVAVWD